MQHEAARVQTNIAALLSKKAALASTMDAQAQLLASPELLQNHPELQYERESHGNMPKLGAARELFAKDMRLSDFR